MIKYNSMNSEKNRTTTLLAMAVLVLVCCAHVGCNKESVYTTEGMGYENDPVYRAALDAQNAEQNAIGKRRSQIAKEMRELVSACGGDKAKAAQLPRWAKLNAEAEKCDNEFKASREKSAAIVRERMQRAVRDSERVKRGEANAIKVSK